MGCEVGLHLSKLGKKVVVLEMADDYASDANEMHMLALRYMVKTLGMTVITGARCTEMGANEVKYIKAWRGQRVLCRRHEKRAGYVPETGAERADRNTYRGLQKSGQSGRGGT